MRQRSKGECDNGIAPSSDVAGDESPGRPVELSSGIVGATHRLGIQHRIGNLSLCSLSRPLAISETCNGLRKSILLWGPGGGGWH